MWADLLLTLAGLVFMAAGSFAKVTVDDKNSQSFVGWVRFIFVVFGALCWRYAW
jgi:hypothetical protein